MSGIRHRCLILGLCAAFPLAAMGGTAQVTLEVVDERGRAVRDGLFVFSLTDDASEQFTLGENDLGQYVESVTTPADDTSWNLSRVLVEGLLPVQISIRSSSRAGEPVQSVEAMELNPGIPIPPVRIVSGGRVEIELTLGDKAAVMKSFLEARTKAREAAEAQAQAEAAATRGPYATALRLYGDGDIEGSLPHFREAIERTPDDPQIRATYANVLYKAKRYEEFDRAAQPLLETQPDNAELWMMVYTARRTRGEMKTALDALIAVKDLGSGGPGLLEHLDFVARKLGRGEQAIRAWRAILELDGGNVDACVALASLYTETGRSDLADSYLDKAVQLAPRQAPALYHQLASRLLGAEPVGPERLARAIELLRQSIELDPGFAPPYKKLGLALWKQQDYAGARQAFQTYLESSPGGEDEEQIKEFLETLPE